MLFSRRKHATHHHNHHQSGVATAPRRSRGLFSRRHEPVHHHNHHETGVATAPRRSHGIFSRRRREPVHHHQRKPSMSDKLSGALLKLKGSLLNKPGIKAAGTRRMRGTDGRGAHHTDHHHIL